MAEETTTIETTVEPTLEELKEQLAQANAERDKYKNANDKLSKSEAEMKRQLRAKLSAEEQLAAEKAEAEKIREAELEALKKELDRNKAFNAYRSVSDENMIEDLIGAVSEANHGAIASIIEKYAKEDIKSIFDYIDVHCRSCSLCSYHICNK